METSFNITFPHKFLVFPFNVEKLLLQHLFGNPSILEQLEPSARQDVVFEELHGDEELHEAQRVFVVDDNPNNLSTDFLARE